MSTGSIMLIIIMVPPMIGAGMPALPSLDARLAPL
ncbi:hypothetical protein ABID62_008965 [Bradyrhizobium sp. S3.9.1]